MNKENDTYMPHHIQTMNKCNLSYEEAVNLVGCIAVDKLQSLRKWLISSGKESVLYSSSHKIVMPAYPFEITVKAFYLIVDGDCELDHREWIPTEYSVNVCG